MIGNSKFNQILRPLSKLFLAGSILLVAIFTFSNSPAFASVNKSFSSCKSLRASSLNLIYGVAMSSSSVGYTGALVDSTMYGENKRLDLDKDGVACELAIYDLGITSSTPGVSSAYEACKSERASKQNVISLMGQLDNYYKYSDTFLVQIAMLEQATKQMEQASVQNKVFASGSKSIKRLYEFVKSSWILSLKGKEATGKVDGAFDEWCVLLGVYPGHRGIFSPINFQTRSPQRTALNGARKVCQSLFYMAPTGQSIYSGSESTTLETCDQNARSVAYKSSTYDAALNEMKRVYFTFHDYWCWGKSCVTKWDIG
jgi:hypothetical protein